VWLDGAFRKLTRLLSIIRSPKEIQSFITILACARTHKHTHRFTVSIPDLVSRDYSFKNVILICSGSYFVFFLLPYAFLHCYSTTSFFTLIFTLHYIIISLVNYFSQIHSFRIHAFRLVSFYKMKSEPDLT